MKKIAVLALLAAALTFFSCDEYFSTSFGTFRSSYDPNKIDVNSGNIDEWIRASAGNPKLQQALSEAINRKLNDPSISPSEKAALLNGGIRIAVGSSGLGNSVLARASELIGKGDEINPNTLTDLLGKVQNDFNTGGGPSAADNIAQMVYSSITGNPPVFDPSYADNVQPADVAEAVLVLALGLMENTGLTADGSNNWQDVQNLAEGLSLSTDGNHITYGGTNKSALALAAYLNLIADQKDRFGNTMTDSLYSAFFSS